MIVRENLVLGQLSELDAKEISTWKYNSPYDVYNSCSWEKLVEFNNPITDSKLRQERYLGLFDISKSIVGIAVFNKPEDNITRIGLGLKPDICGRGLGEQFLKLIIQEAKRRNPENIIDLEVLTWNKRAIKVYEKSGFQIIETYVRKTPTGEGEFHKMKYMRNT